MVNTIASVFELFSGSKEMMQKSPKVIQRILRSPLLVVESEDVLVEMLIPYCEHRADDFDALSLFELIKAENLSSDFCQTLIQRLNPLALSMLAKRRLSFVETESSWHEFTKRYCKRNMYELSVAFLEHVEEGKLP